MKIIIDVNILFSALIRDSTTRTILVKSGFDFYFPEPSLHKIRKYKEYILEKTGLDEREYTQLISLLFNYIKLIPTEQIEKHWEEAKQIMAHIDEEDVTFIAAALGTTDSIIWSDDADFDKQQKIAVFKTKDIVLLFGGE
ncbi:MAG: PIN domain-containing protein [Nanoarchaeota archaeon]